MAILICTYILFK